MDSDVWSVTDLDSYRSDVDEEDCCDSDDRDMLEDVMDSDIWSLQTLIVTGRMLTKRTIVIRMWRTWKA